MSEFSHVADHMLRHVLTREASQVRLYDIRQATSRTIEELGYDVIDDAIPATALEYRIEMAKEARDAAKRWQVRKAHSALRQFWLA